MYPIFGIVQSDEWLMSIDLEFIEWNCKWSKFTLFQCYHRLVSLGKHPFKAVFNWSRYSSWIFSSWPIVSILLFELPWTLTQFWHLFNMANLNGDVSISLFEVLSNKSTKLFSPAEANISETEFVSPRSRATWQAWLHSPRTRKILPSFINFSFSPVMV